MTPTGLKNGLHMPSATARATTTTFDKWEMVDRSQKDALLVLNRYYNTAGNARSCPICANHKSHPFTSCPALIARGFTVCPMTLPKIRILTWGIGIRPTHNCCPESQRVHRIPRVDQ